MNEQLNPYWHKIGESEYQLRSKMCIGTAKLLSAIETTDLYDEKTKEDVTRTLITGWKEIKDFFTRGGAVSQKGKFLTTDLLNSGFHPQLLEVIKDKKVAHFRAKFLKDKYQMNFSEMSIRTDSVIYFVDQNTNMILRQEANIKRDNALNGTYIESNGRLMEVPSELINLGLFFYFKNLLEQEKVRPIVAPTTAINELLTDIVRESGCGLIPEIRKRHREQRLTPKP